MKFFIDFLSAILSGILPLLPFIPFVAMLVFIPEEEGWVIISFIVGTVFALLLKDVDIDILKTWNSKKRKKSEQISVFLPVRGMYISWDGKKRKKSEQIEKQDK